MSNNVYSAGIRNAGSYQVSGQPYLSGSVTSATLGSNVDGHFIFPYVTKRVTVYNESSTRDAILSFSPFKQSEAAGFGFANSASGSGNWLFLQRGTSIDLDVKCKEIFVAPATAHEVDSISVSSELTNIRTSGLYSYDGLEGISSNSLGATQNSYFGVGINNVGSYLVSGQPYITGSFIDGGRNKIGVGEEISVKFPRVVKSFSVWNYSSDASSKLRITFANTGSIQNYPACYIELSQNETRTLNVKCNEIYLSAVSGDVFWKVYGSMTGIPRERMYQLTGSGITH